jgi:hypothetical protein
MQKTKILVFKKGGKLKKNEKWFMHDQLIEVVNELSYLGITLESTGGWNRHRKKQMVKGKDPIHILLKCSETRKWREQFLSRKWLRLNEWIVFKKIINSSNSIELRIIGSYLCKIKCKWDNRIRNLSSELGSRAVVIS